MLGKFSRRLRVASAGACCLFIASCMSNRYEPIPQTGANLSGTVTYKGQKVTGGTVTVAGQTPGSNGEIKPDGTYEVSNVPLGEVIIGINTVAAKASRAATKAASKDAPPPPIVDVPAKYLSPGSSGIKTTTKPGANTFDIVIE